MVVDYKSKNFICLNFGLKGWNDNIAWINLSYEILLIINLRSWIKSLSEY